MILMQPVWLMPVMFTAARIRLTRGQPNSQGTLYSRRRNRSGFELDFASQKNLQIKA